MLEAGGWIRNNRVQGVLAVTRALGDVEYKTLKEACWEQAFASDPLSAFPDVAHVTLDPADEFLLVVSDGVCAAMSAPACARLVSSELARSGNVQVAAERLAARCISMGSKDNVSVLLLVFE